MKIGFRFTKREIVEGICCCFNKSACIDREECDNVVVSSEVVGNCRSLRRYWELVVMLIGKLWNSDLLLTMLAAYHKQDKISEIFRDFKGG